MMPSSIANHLIGIENMIHKIFNRMNKTKQNIQLNYMITSNKQFTLSNNAFARLEYSLS